MSTKLIRILAFAALIFFLLFSLALGYLVTAAGLFSTPTLLADIGLQRARSQRIAKDVLILARANASIGERGRATNEMLAIMEIEPPSSAPAFEQTQNDLEAGKNISRVPEQVKVYLAEARPHLNAILRATQNILLDVEKPPDPVQVALILDHEVPYSTAMSLMNLWWQDRLDDGYAQASRIALGMLVCLLLLFLTEQFLLLGSSLRALRTREQNIAVLLAQIQEQQRQNEKPPPELEKHNTAPLPAIKENKEQKEEPQDADK